MENDEPAHGDIRSIEARLAVLDAERMELLSQLARLKQVGAPSDTSTNTAMSSAKDQLTVGAKLTLFRRLFHGRDDVYALRWDDPKSGKSGYAPACRYEWPPGVTKKSEATRILFPLTNRVILSHLNGDITIGTYPLLLDVVSQLTHYVSLTFHLFRHELRKRYNVAFSRCRLQC